MDDKDCNDTISALTDTLRKKEMLWVLDQVNEQIRLGKTESKEILHQGEDHRQNTFPGMETKRKTAGDRTRKKEEFLVSTEYIPQEKLLLLIDAIEQAVINTSKMIYETLKFTHEKFGIDEIIFYAQENQRTKTFSSLEFAEADKQISRLKDLLENLRKQVNAN